MSDTATVVSPLKEGEGEAMVLHSANMLLDATKSNTLDFFKMS